MFGWLKRFIIRKRTEELRERLQIKSDGQTISLSTENLTEEERTAFYEAVRQRTGVATFNDKIEHAYGKEYARQTDHCPRCKQETQQHYAEFLYLVDEGIRALFAPAGYFCSRCPTVIVDEALLKAGISGNYQYLGTLGINDATQDEPTLFRTWNGRPPVIVLRNNDERYYDSLDSGPAYSESKYRKLVNKRKMQRASRKRNRR